VPGYPKIEQAICRMAGRKETSGRAAPDMNTKEKRSSSDFSVAAKS